MSTSWYYLTMDTTLSSPSLFYEAYFSANLNPADPSYIVQAFYDASNMSIISGNILDSLALPVSSWTPDNFMVRTNSLIPPFNIYLFEPSGVNINSSYLKNALNNAGYNTPTLTTNYYNIRNNSGNNLLYPDSPSLINLPSLTITIVTTTNPFVCFKEGSKILTDKGYIPIENLRKGDLIKTSKNGYVPINMIGSKSIYNSVTNERNKDSLYVCSKDQYPEITEDLVITGCHSILVDNFKDDEQRSKAQDVLGGTIYVTEQKYRLPACVDPRAQIYNKEGHFVIYHLALDHDNYYKNYGVYANGLLVESCSKRYMKEYSQMKLIE
uniref:Hedgehog/Intein (Hint) domain-containing protein n=1 Tax=viral metagenome TaxID=1070528 RepID=A0A6C0HXD0_9ZZZZ